MYYISGAPAVLLAILILVTVKEAERGATDKDAKVIEGLQICHCRRAYLSKATANNLSKGIYYSNKLSHAMTSNLFSNFDLQTSSSLCILINCMHLFSRVRATIVISI